ncbi:MAG: hypothetical protein JNL19_03115 [Burkholderiales bacterium]|nr:hypothetical protein [Burkholderiales bacterium]
MKLDAATVGAVLWPAFLGAAAADGVVFTLIDPVNVDIFDIHTFSRPAAYTLGFFFFWLVIVGSSALSLWMHEGATKAAPIVLPDDHDVPF